MSTVFFETGETIQSAYKDYAQMLIKHCRYRRCSSEDAEEIVNEAFVKAFQYLNQGKKVENIRAFLFRTTENLIIDRVRKAKHKREISLDALQEQGLEVEEKVNHSRSIRNTVEVNMLLKTMKDQLEEGEYDLLVMRYIKGLMPMDIAKKMGITSNTVSVRLHRAVKKITDYIRFNQGKDTK